MDTLSNPEARDRRSPPICGDETCEVCRFWPQGTYNRRRLNYRVQAWVNYGHDCYLCGEPAQTLDHVIPKSWGGPSLVWNLRPCCKPCNGKKGSDPVLVKESLAFAELPEVLLERFPPPPDGEQLTRHERGARRRRNRAFVKNLVR